MVIPLTTAGPTQAADRINRLLRHAPRGTYLEVGVQSGRTFTTVQAGTCVGVDPRFRFDVTALDPATHLTMETTSDEFFAQAPAFMAAAAIEDFGVVYLDGLHTADQTYRDLVSALSLLHPAGAILIDDVVPSDVYSSLTPQSRAMSKRAIAGSTTEDWHGDVFKLLFLVHDFHPNLDYRLILGPGNPQALVWRVAGIWRRPIVGSLVAVASMDYFQFTDLLPALQVCDEANAITSWRSAFAPGQLGLER